MRLAALYTIFNGTELLERSVAQIKDQVDLIVLGSQEVSNAGNEMALHDAINVANLEGNLKEAGRDCVLINFRPSTVKSRKENERRKLNQMIETARILGATHFALLATDHFYDPDDFKRGKYIAETMDVDVTLTEMFTYYKKPTWRLTEVEAYWMPFICKINDKTHAVRTDEYPVKTDPSVRVAPVKSFHTFPQNHIMLHHFSMVRKNISDKFSNAAAAQNWPTMKAKEYLREFKEYDIKENPGVSYFGGITLEETVDKFGLEALDL